MWQGAKHIGSRVKVKNLHFQRAQMLKDKGYIVLNFTLIDT